MTRILVLATFILCATLPLRAQDLWFTTGLLNPSVGNPLAVNTQLLDYLNIYDQEAKPTAQVVVTSSVNAVIAIQRIAADGTTIIHEQALAVAPFTTFSISITVRLDDDEHLRIVNKVALNAGSLWVSEIIN